MTPASAPLDKTRRRPHPGPVARVTRVRPAGRDVFAAGAADPAPLPF